MSRPNNPHWQTCNQNPKATKRISDQNNLSKKLRKFQNWLCYKEITTKIKNKTHKWIKVVTAHCLLLTITSTGLPSMANKKRRATLNWVSWIFKNLNFIFEQNLKKNGLLSLAKRNLYFTVRALCGPATQCALIIG